MDDNTNTTLFVIVGVIILAVILIAFNTKLPDMIEKATKNVAESWQTQ